MVTPPVLQDIYTKMEQVCRATGIIAGKSGKHMKFPYTISAKVAQFPFFHYMKYNNIWMYYPMGLLVGLYAFVKIHRLVNSDSNKASWAETQRKNAAKEAHH